MAYSVCRILAAGVLACGFGSHVAMADVITAPETLGYPYLTQVQSSISIPYDGATTYYRTFGTYSQSTGGSTATVSVTGGADPSVTASVSAAPGSSVSAQASLAYFIEILGPSGSVPVDIVSLSSSTVGSDVAPGVNPDAANTILYVSALGMSNPTLGVIGNSCAGSYGAACQEGHIVGTTVLTTGPYMLPTNDVIEIDLAANAQASANSPYPGFSASASVDPLISIDSSVSNPSAYSIIYSADLPQTPVSVPEPAACEFQCIAATHYNLIPAGVPI